MHEIKSETIGPSTSTGNRSEDMYGLRKATSIGDPLRDVRAMGGLPFGPAGLASLGSSLSLPLIKKMLMEHMMAAAGSRVVRPIENEIKNKFQQTFSGMSPMDALKAQWPINYFTGVK